MGEGKKFGLSDREYEFLKRWWDKFKPERMTFIEVVNLYKNIKKLAEEMGIPDPETWVQNNWDLVDSTLSYSENLARLESEVYTYGREAYMPEELEEMEFWKKRAEELEKQLKHAFTLEQKRELERKIRELKHKLKRKEAEIERLRQRAIPEEEREKLLEYEDMLKDASIEELLTSLELLEKEIPSEMSERELQMRINAIKKELTRRGVPRSKATGRFLRPMTEWKGYPVPPEMRFWYDPYERRYYRDNKPVTPEQIDKAMRQLLKPIEQEMKAYRKAPRQVREVIMPDFLEEEAKRLEPAVQILYRVRFEKLPPQVREHYLVKMFEQYSIIEAIQRFSKYRLEDLTESEYHDVLDYAIDTFVSKAPGDIYELADLLKDYVE